MIRIGLTQKQKHHEIKEYVSSNPVKSVIVFSPEKFKMELPDLGDIPIRQIEYNEVIMYRTFYPLLEEIGNDHLLVVNEFMRTRNRNDLTYNCLRHYLNQCGHSIIFEYFPFIKSNEDFMILLDFDTKSKYKGTGFRADLIEGEDVRCQRYDTIPRQLHVFCGKWKRPLINSELEYVARNARFSKPNVVTFPNAKPGHNYTLLDFPSRRMDFNDFLRRTEQHRFTFLSTGFSVDQYYINSFNEWKKRLEEFYAQTSVYAGDGR